MNLIRTTKDDRIRALIPLTLLIAGCEQSPGAKNDAQPAVTGAATGFSPVQQRVLDLPERQREGVLFRAIRDGGAPCSDLTEGARQPDQHGDPVFVARCRGGLVM